ncbi:MAG: hypothetical protein R6U51_04490 [Anaerolineales bacterium]
MELPPNIIRAHMNEERGHVPLNVIHASSGYKADLYLVQDGDLFSRVSLPEEGPG